MTGVQSVGSTTAANPRQPLLEIDNLSVTFHRRNSETRAVDGVSYSVAPGEIVGVVGESGSGPQHRRARCGDALDSDQVEGRDIRQALGRGCRGREPALVRRAQIAQHGHQARAVTGLPEQVGQPWPDGSGGRAEQQRPG